MKKYLKYIVFSMILFLTLCFSVAALDCYYLKEYGDVDGDGEKEILEAHFRINENDNTIVFSGVNGTMKSKDDNNANDDTDLPDLFRTVKGQNQSVENWDKSFKPVVESEPVSDFQGNQHYSDNNECPPYAILVDRVGQFDLLVANETTKDAYKTFGDKKQGVAIMEKIEISDQIVRYPSSCLGLNQNSCKLNENFACVWVDEDDYDFIKTPYCNVDNLVYVGCGGASDIPVQVPALISMAVNLLKIATPIILIFISIITLVKAMSAGKEDEIKKATNSLVKKMIAAALVFFVVAIVQFIVSKVATDEEEYENFGNCLNCFLNNSCEQSTYYKTVISGEDWCTDVATGNSDLCKK